MECFLTVNEVAARLKVSRNTIYQMVKVGELPSIRLGVGRGAIRVMQDDLQHYIEAKRVVPPDIKEDSINGSKPVKLKHLRIKS